ncbi:hypothetical protein AAF712_009088 [Marasmius tenuissimus]|uniref:F-box domain-containing protein n=1 Tax=Marasmius tenuissimus TaxID=585030 RepID=A0ABR2ZQR1_9AGAR
MRKFRLPHQTVWTQNMGKVQIETVSRSGFVVSRASSNKKTLQASINTLPPELLTEIFAYFLPTRDDVAMNSTPDVPYLLTFLSVCKYWRHASLRTPYLWSTILMVSPTLTRPDTMVKQWLERSATHPLTLILVLSPSSEEGVQDVDMLRGAVQALSTLTEHIHRWKSLDLRMSEFPTHSEHQFGLQLPSSLDAAPLLERVVVEEEYSLTGDEAESFWRTVGGYSAVRHAAWSTSLKGPRSCLPLFGTRWDKLTSLRSELTVDDHTLRYLSQCGSLEHLTVSILKNPSPGEVAPRRCYPLPQLRRLAITSYHSDRPLTLFLQSIEVPSLDDLELSGGWNSNKAWMDLFERSSCRLKTLWLCDDTFSGDAAPQCLSSPAVADLKELTVQLIYEAEACFKFLTWTSEAEFLPVLRKIVIQTTSRFTIGQLERMLESRLEHPRNTLECASVHYLERHYQQGELVFLDRLRNNGLNVEMVCID